MKGNYLKAHFFNTGKLGEILIVLLLSTGYMAKAQRGLQVLPNIKYCAAQTEKMLNALPVDGDNHKAEAMLQTLSSSSYQSRQVNNAFSLHSTGHHPAGVEIDASIIYADCYYLEALLRLEKLQHIKAYHYYKLH